MATVVLDRNQTRFFFSDGQGGTINPPLAQSSPNVIAPGPPTRLTFDLVNIGLASGTASTPQLQLKRYTQRKRIQRWHLDRAGDRSGALAGGDTVDYGLSQNSVTVGADAELDGDHGRAEQRPGDRRA